MVNIEDLPAKISSNISVASNGCWEWKRYLTLGYGHMMVNRKMYQAHRLIFEMFIHKIPKGLVLDHLCRNRKCVNPEHLEAVTMQVNILRGEGLAAKQARRNHCIRGHLFEKRGGIRICVICMRERCKKATRKYRQKKKDLAK